MGRTIKFYYDFLSPYSYLASTQLPAIAERHSCEIDYKPIHVLRLMERVGNQPTTILCETKLAYAFQDLDRWSKEYRVPIAPNPHLKSIDVTPLLLGAIAAGDVGVIREYTAAVFEAYWEKQAAFSEPDELPEIIRAAGIPDSGGILGASIGFADRLEANISEGVEDGVFGVPSFVCDAGLYFGNDRLDFLEKGLSA